jgi:hypothetical protein
MCYRAVAESSALPEVTRANFASNQVVQPNSPYQMLSLSFPSGDAPRTGRQVNEWKDNQGEIFARAFSSDHRCWIDWPGLGVFAFAAGSNEVQVWPDHNAPTADILETFSRRLQPIILQALGWQALHAAAVATPSGAIAFCGNAGSGKSTLGFAMQRAGYSHLADDGLVLRLDQDRVTACPIPFAPRLRPASRAHFGYSGEQQPPPVEIESAELPLSAVFLLHQDLHTGRPRVRLLPQAQAFSALLAHAHCYDAQDRRHTQRLADSYLAMVSLVPVFALQYRPGLQQLPQLTEIIKDAAGTCSAKSSTFRLPGVVP